MTLLAGATLAWLGISVLMAAQDGGWALRPSAWIRAWGLTMPRWAPGLVLTLAVFALARTAPIRSPHWKRHLALHVSRDLPAQMDGRDPVLDRARRLGPS
jgi:uncharacterized BrkB/YihY/UPF0761 family membrane protein